jgi:hypothetical protein
LRWRLLVLIAGRLIPIFVGHDGFPCCPGVDAG